MRIIRISLRKDVMTLGMLFPVKNYWIDFVWMRVVFAPEVEEDLYGLIKILVEKEYLGTYPFAISYVEELIADIQQNIHSKLKKKAPAFFERYGKDMYYITYQRNSNTTWYIFFSVIGDTYFIKYITNNHVSGQYIF